MVTSPFNLLFIAFFTNSFVVLGIPTIVLVEVLASFVIKTLIFFSSVLPPLLICSIS